MSLGGCGSMYEIIIDSAKFEGKRPVQQHRMVNDVSEETFAVAKT